MSERKKRTRTGCLTCRSRRVKCDERKPTCERCETANVQCAGYEEPRVVVKRRKVSSASPAALSGSGLATSPISSPQNWGSTVNPQSPLVAFPVNPTDYQIPHPRAREVLGHQQFVARTVNLLFRQAHLYFWRDQIMQIAWDTEYVFDAIIAVGNMHRSVLLLSKPNDQYRGTDVRIMATEYYGRTLRQIADIYGQDYSKTSETLTAVLLLLTFFECFANNVTGALRHLCIAQQHLSSLEELHAIDGTSLPNRDALVACANDLALTARLALPLAPITLSLSIDMIVPQVVFGGAADVDEEFQQLIALIRTDTLIRAACWQPFSEAEASVSVPELVSFQETLQRWKESATLTYQDYVEPLEFHSPVSDTSPGSDRADLPPPGKTFTAIKAALGAALFNTYMGRTMWMRWQAADEDSEFCMEQADKYAYDNLCIAQGLWVENDQRPLEQRIYLPGERIHIGLTPLLYCGTHFSRHASWVSWSKARMRSIGQEGIYYSFALAACLDFGDQLGQMDGFKPAFPTTGTTRDTTDLILLPDTEGRRFVTYLMRRTSDSTRPGGPLVRIVGSARWDASAEAGLAEAELIHFEADHLLNQGVLSKCPYKRLAAYEPFASEWESLLANPTYSPAAYLPTDFDFSSIMVGSVSNGNSTLGTPG